MAMSTKESMLILVSNKATQTSMNDYNCFTHAVETNVTISPSGSSIAGGNSTLVCSATITPDPLPDNIPSSSSLMFEWFFGPNEGPLPSGVAAASTSLISRNIFRSTLHISPLSQSYAGNYTCRFWGIANLEACTTLTVNCTSVNLLHE